VRARLALLAAIVLVPALLAFALLRLAARGDREAPPHADGVHEQASAPDRWLGGALDPGPLAAGHADLAGVSNCLECHGTASEVLDARCVACHEEIGARARVRAGWHGTFDAPCRTCHAEHRGANAALIDFDRKTFQHDLARFPLRGEHASAKCEECHRMATEAGDDGAMHFHYQGVPFASCTACHVDPHAGRAKGARAMAPIRQVALDAPPPAPPAKVPGHPIAGGDCKSCHAEASFAASRLRRGGFDHAVDTTFRLEGAHAALACESCHTKERRAEERAAGLAPGTAAKAECASCHQDPHRGALRRASGCGSCHTPEGWHIDAFDHAKHTDFPLDDLHASLDCASCHSDDRFRAAGTRCADCHRDAAELLAGRFEGQTAEPDPHAREVACADCHRPTVAANRPAALAARCVECHTPEYGSLLATWTAKLDALAGLSTLEPEQAERLRHSGVHNFAFAHRRLQSTVRAR